MWRAFFLAIGAYLILLGAQCLGVEKFVLRLHEPPKQQVDAFGNEQQKPGPQREVVPPDWAPYSLMSTGAVVCLYSFSIPIRVKGK